MEQTKIIAVTNRKLYERPFLEQIRRIVEKKPYAIILREKDLPEPEYEELAAQEGVYRRFVAARSGGMGWNRRWARWRVALSARRSIWR